MATNIAEAAAEVESRILAACARSGRDRREIELIAVTKYVGLAQVQAVLDEGLTHIGENRWQDAKPKWEAVGPRATWHFIGHLQTNKVKEVFGKFAYIHSLDRLSLAEELNKRAEQAGQQVRCFIQLNISGEETKHGLAPEQLDEFAAKVGGMSGIKVVGLMTMAPHAEKPETVRPVFRRLRELRDGLNASGVLGYAVPHLSMGMSNDFEIAVEEGATWLRLGSILVGRD